MQYVSNTQRKQITIGQFLADHHFSSSAAFADYSDTLLRKKLGKVLGDKLNRDINVEWDVDGVRTSPIDHKIDSDSISSFLQDVANSNESVQDADQRISVTDGITGVEEVKSLRDHAHIQVLRDAKRLTKLPDDMEQYKYYYEN